MGTAILMDFRAKDPVILVEKTLKFYFQCATGFILVRVFIHNENISISARRKKEREWQKAFDNWRSQLDGKFEIEVHYDVLGSTGPCSDWWKNCLLAFEDERIDRVIYLPYDLTYLYPKLSNGLADKRIQDFIDRINENNIDLLLGNYHARTPPEEADSSTFFIGMEHAGDNMRSDIRKNVIEEYTLAKMYKCFPNCTKWYLGQRTDSDHKPSPRTGWFGISRRFFEDFKQYKGIFQPWAATCQLNIFCALMNIKKESKYRFLEMFIGDLKHPPEKYDDYSLAHQLLRVSFVIENEREFWAWKYPELYNKVYSPDFE